MDKYKSKIKLDKLALYLLLIISFFKGVWYFDLYFNGRYAISTIIIKESGQSPSLIYEYTVEGKKYTSSGLFKKRFNIGDKYVIIYSDVFNFNSFILNDWKVDSADEAKQLIDKPADPSHLRFWEM